MIVPLRCEMKCRADTRRSQGSLLILNVSIGARCPHRPIPHTVVNSIGEHSRLERWPISGRATRLITRYSGMGGAVMGWAHGRIVARGTESVRGKGQKTAHTDTPVGRPLSWGISKAEWGGTARAFVHGRFQRRRCERDSSGPGADRMPRTRSLDGENGSMILL